MFLASKDALPHLRDSTGGDGPGSGDGEGGAIVSISARSSLEGGERGGAGLRRSLKD